MRSYLLQRQSIGEIPEQDLVASKFLGQDLDKYRSLFQHVAAAIQLGKSGKFAAVYSISTQTQIADVATIAFMENGTLSDS